MRSETPTHFVISRRNATELLRMLDKNIHRKPAIMGDGFLLQIEEDDVHYGQREHAAGKMSYES